MMKLHPDKVGVAEYAPKAARALEMVHEAKGACELLLSRQELPGPPRNLVYALLCATPGKRRFQLRWDAPLEREKAPVRRYIVAALMGVQLTTLTVLEPDYDAERRRFVSMDELCSFALAEEELEKLPALFQQPLAVVQVASANDAGQSAWASIAVAMPGVAAPGGFFPWLRVAPPGARFPWPTPGFCPGPGPAARVGSGPVATAPSQAQQKYMEILARQVGRRPTAEDLASKTSASSWISRAKAELGA